MTQSKRLQGHWEKIVIQSALGLILLSAPALFWAGSRSLEKTHSGPKNPKVLAAPGLPTAPGPASGQDALSKAQAKLPASALPIDQIIEQVHFAFRPQDSGYQGTHSTYRVQVSEDGAWKFTPYRYQSPSEAKAGAPLELETTSISRGDKATPAQALLVHSDEKAELDIERSQATEHLRNQKEGVEQSWSFTHPPQGQGDLVLRIRAAGLAYAGQTEQGLHFSDPDSGMGVRYGAATWIDAHGARTSVSPSRVGDQIELRVPSRVIEQSAYPAVLDPVVGPEFSIDMPVLTPAALSEANPTMASGPLGTFLLVWTSHELGHSQVYAARVSSDDHAVLDPHGIRLSGSTSDQDSPAVGYNGSHFLVTWRDRRNGNDDIYGTRVDATSGAVLDPQGMAISRLAGEQSSPAVIGRDGRFFVVWKDNRSGAGFDIFGARIDGIAGTVLDPNGVLVCGAAGNQSQPTVGQTFASNNIFVAWTDERNGADSDIYGTLVDSQSATVQTPQGQLISGAQGRQSAPKLSVMRNPYGEMAFVAWQDERNGTDSDIYAALWNSQSAPTPALPQEPLAVLPGAQSTPAVTCPSSGAYCLVLWDDTRSGAGHEVYYRRYEAGHGLLDSDQGKRLSASALGEPIVPSADWDGGRFAFVWSDSPSGHTGLYTNTLYYNSEAPLSTPSDRIQIDAGQGEPRVAFDGTNYLVVWTDGASNQSNIYGARLRGSDGSLLDPAGIAISTAVQRQWMPAVAFDGTQFWVAWAGHRDGFMDDIFAARVGSDGSVLDRNPIGVCNNLYNQYAPTLAVGSDSVLIAWNDERAGSQSDIYGARLGSSDGQLLDPQGIVISQAPQNQVFPAAAFDGFHYLVAWEDSRSGVHSQIYAARVDQEGSVLDPDGVAVAQTAGDQHWPAVTFGASEYLVVWADNQNIMGSPVNMDAFGARPFTIADGPALQVAPSITWTGNQYLVSWYDEQTGPNVYFSRINRDGTVLDPQGLPLSQGPGSASLPDICAGLPGSALVVYRWTSGAEAGSTQLRAHLLSDFAQGQGCAVTGDCPSGSCVDGVCCDAPCTGQCEACDLPGNIGHCTPIQGPPHGARPACQGSGTCQGSCDGVQADSCVFPAATSSCAPGFCIQGQYLAPSTCDGQGSCITPEPVSCGAYACRFDQCNTQCQNPPDCAPGFTCQNHVCVQAQDAGTDAPNDSGTDSDAGPDAPPDSPSPEASSEDAPSGTDAAPGLPEQQDAGCGCAVPRGASLPPAGAGLLGLLGLGWLARRRAKWLSN